MHFQVIFTDEAMIEINQQQVHYVRRRIDEPLRQVHFRQQRGFSTKIMFWGAITIFGPGCLVPVEGTMCSEKYVDILDIHLMPLAQNIFGEQPWKLLQDGARCHTSQRTTKFLEEKGIQCVEWSSYSPDMNAIENVWSVLKRKLYRQGSGKSRSEVIERAQKIWEEDDELRHTAINCVMSMTNRVSQLYHMKGGNTTF
jgi:hypothetical protein